MQNYHIQTNGLEEGENGTLYALTGNNPIADVCHALKNVAAKMNAVADAHVNVPDSHVHHYAHARVNLEVLFFHVRYIVGAIQYVQMLL